MMTPEAARPWTQGMWLVLMAVWVAGMFTTRQTVRRQSGGSRIVQMAVMLLGAWLLFGRGPVPAWDAPAFPATNSTVIAGLVTTLAGVLFAIWARLTLGANWSGVITVKAGHTLIQRGPYRVVRHPIYTGILIAATGTALTQASIRSVVALPVLGFGFWLKTLTEEQFMIAEFGEEYLRYKHDVRALVPFLF
jgi:protein-S-isoprenylcysteine O-methyltransferase